MGVIPAGGLSTRASPSAISMTLVIFTPMPHKGQNASPQFTAVIGGLPASVPFVAPEALERAQSARLRLRLGANESAFGVSPVALVAMREAAAQTNWYGDPESYDLRLVLSEELGISPDNVLVGNGIDGLLGYVVRALVEPGVPVVTSRGTYPTFSYHAAAYGGTIYAVPYRDDRPDLESLLETAKRTRARLVYLANPDNPSGSWHTAFDVGRFVSDLPSDCVLALDEAYHEFAPPDAVLTVDVARENLIRVRTFSKAHGMAGARVGYAIAHADMISTFGKFRNQFEVSRVSQAGALASLADREFVEGVIKSVADGRADYTRLASELGLATIPSATQLRVH